MEDGNQRAIGIEMNGHAWDGDKWVPIPPRPASSGRQHVTPLGGSAAPPFQMWQQGGLQSGGFSDPHYGYGFTRQTSDDLQFIARFFKIMILIWIVLAILAIIIVPLTLGSLLAATSGLVPHAAR